jgi:carbonic anhydrase
VRLQYKAGDCTVDALVFTISDHSIQATYNASLCSPPKMTIPNVSATYEVLQFHFHTGSEHALDGKHFGGEIHVVHKELGGQGLEVLGLFVEPTSYGDTHYFDALIPKWEFVAEATLVVCAKNETDVAVTQGLHRRSLAQKERDSRNVAESFNPYSLVPEGSTYYFYSGSLTTPPCTEIVSWNVVDKPVSLSVHEYNALVDLILRYESPETCSLATVAAPSGETSRPTQPINGRTITHKCPTGTELQFNNSQEQSRADIFNVALVTIATCMTSLLLIDSI